MPSFDIVSELDKHEVTNAAENSAKELERRYDLRDKASLEHNDKQITITAEADFMLPQVLEIIRLNLVKRKIDIQCMDIQEPYASGKVIKQEIKLREGIDRDLAKKIVSLVKDSKIKVQASIQGEQVRVSGKKRDDLQQVMALLREQSLGMPLQFNNFRD